MTNRRRPIDRWMICFYLINLLASIAVLRLSIITGVLGLAAILLVTFHPTSPKQRIFAIAVGLLAGVLVIWRIHSNWSIAFAVFDALFAVAILQTVFSKFTFAESVIFMIKQSIQFETIYVLMFGFIVAILPQLYQKNSHSSRGKTSMIALSAEVSPGRVAKLVQGNGIAFTVRFDSDALERLQSKDLYWVAAKLSEADGLTWRQGQKLTSLVTNDIESEKSNIAIVHQEIFINASPQTLLPALEFPFKMVAMVKNQNANVGKDSFGNNMTRGLTWNHGFRYDAWSIPHSSPTKLNEEERTLYTRLSTAPSPRLQQLAQSLDHEPGNALAAAISIQNYLLENHFTYSLESETSVQTIDDFLFSAKKGFCEHYAASFATLLRLMHYPARLVVGYQGGLRSRISSKLIVRDQDAHVWTEIWSNATQSWVRSDPTAFVAFERIHHGSDILFASDVKPFFSDWFFSFRSTLSEASPDWISIVRAYDSQWANDFLDQLVAILGEYTSAVALMLGLLSAFLIWKGLRRFLFSLRRDPLASVQNRLRRKWTQLGIECAPSDTVTIMCQKARIHVSESSKKNLEKFATDFNQIKYGPSKASPYAVRELRRLIESIHAESSPFSLKMRFWRERTKN